MGLRVYEEDLVFFGYKIIFVEEGVVIRRIDCFREREEIGNYLVDIFLERCNKYLNWLK